MSALERAIAHPQPVRGFSSRSPLHGLDRRSIGFVEVLAQSVSAVAPAAAATTMPLLVASIAGSATVVSVATAGLLSLLVAGTVNQFTRRLAATGSLYTFVSKGFGAGRGGTAAAFLTGAAMLAGYGFIAMFSLAGGAHYLGILAGRAVSALAGSPWVTVAFLVLLAGIVMLVLARGIRLSARVTLLVEAISVAILLGLVITLLVRVAPHVDWSVYTRESFGPGESALPEFAVGAVLALGAFVGFESSAGLGVEVRRPFRNVPRSLIWTVLGSGVFYVLATAGQVAGFEVLGKDFSSSTSPVNELAAGFGVDAIGLLLDVGIAASFFACAIASTTALARVLFSLGRDGLLPERFGTTHRRHRTPLFAFAVSVPVIAAVPIAFVLTGASAWHTMQVLIVVGAAGYITAYILVCIAAPVFLHRIGELTLGPLLGAVVAAVTLSAALITYLLMEATGARATGVWLFLAIIVAAAVIHIARLKTTPRLGERIGAYDEPIAIDVLGGVADHQDSRG